MPSPFTMPGPVPPSVLDEAVVRAMPWDGLVPLEQVLTFALPAHGERWSQVLTDLWSFPGDRQTVEDLLAELRPRLAADARASFDRPVVVAFTDPVDWDEQDVADFGPRPVQPRVTNGQHRIAAAVLAGADWLRVACPGLPGAAPVPDLHDDDLVVVRAQLGSPRPGLDVFDAAAEWLRSFRLTPTVWVETDGLSCVDGVFEWVFYCPHALADQLVAALACRADAHAMTLDVLGATPTRWDDLLADDAPADA